MNEKRCENCDYFVFFEHSGIGICTCDLSPCYIESPDEDFKCDQWKEKEEDA